MWPRLHTNECAYPSLVSQRYPMQVLLLSQRRISNLVAFCLAYELEDTVAGVTDALRLDVTGAPSLEFSRRAYKLTRVATGSQELARRLAPSPICAAILEHDFQLFFPIFS